jgi:hypothetical protein
MDDESDIHDVMHEEMRRGKSRRPVDLKTKKERAELLQGLRELLKDGDERDFLKALSALGIDPGSPEHFAALRVWHEQRRR